MDESVLTGIGAGICLAIGVLIGNYVGEQSYQLTAIEAGVGQYNPKTAEFEFITCKEKEESKEIQAE